MERKIVGVLPSQSISRLIADKIITADIPIEPNQVQPASLDLRLGKIAWRVRASFLTGEGKNVKDLLDKYYTSVDFFWEVNDERWQVMFDDKFTADVANVKKEYQKEGTFSPDIWDEIIKKQFTKVDKNWKDNGIIKKEMVDCRFKYWVKNRQDIKTEVAYVTGLNIDMKPVPNCLPLEKRWHNLNELFRKVKWSKPTPTPPPVHIFTTFSNFVEKIKL